MRIADRRRQAAKKAARTREERKKKVDTTTAPRIQLAAETDLETAPTEEGKTPETPAPNKEQSTVQLKLKGLDKRGRNAIYTGAAVALRFPIGAFPDKAPPQTLEVGGVAGPKEKRPPMTAEERKAARAAKPKLTLAERIAKQEEQLAKRKEKLAREQAAAQAASQPSL